MMDNVINYFFLLDIQPAKTDHLKHVHIPIPKGSQLEADLTEQLSIQIQSEKLLELEK